MQSFLGGARSRASSRRRKNLPWPHRRITGEWLEQRTVLSANLNFAIAGVLPNGELAQQGYAVRTDAAGNIYELTDQNVIKYDAAGRQLWSLPYDANIGLGDSAKEGLAVDNAGDVYITGGFDNLAGSPATFGSTSLVSAGADDGFLAKISSAGSFLWAQSFGGSGDDKAYAVATDSSGNAYVTGYINGTAAIGSGTNAQILNIGKGQDILVAKFDADGTLAWANAYGNNDITNEGRGIAVDGQGNVYVTGSFDGTVNFGATQFYSFFGSAFFMKLDTNGQIQWVEKLNTEPDNNDGMAHGYAIAVDSAGNVYATGQFGGDVDLNPKGGDLVTVSNFVFEDTYVLKLSTAGNFVWAADLHHVAGLGGLRANDIAVSPQGNVYTTGWYDGTANFSPNGLYLKTSSGFDDVFVSALKNNGTFLWAATAGEASFSDDGYGIAATTGPGGDYVYAVGTFSNGLDQNANQVGVNFNSGLGPADTVLANGTWDSFLWGLDSLPTRINGLVWNDQNGDGIRQSSEPGVPNITVQLFYGTPGSGTPVASTVTDSLGLYSFNGVAPGNNYYVQVAPAGGVFTGENAGSDPTIASNVSPTSGDSGAITVAAGQTVLVNAGLQTVVSSPGLNLAFGIPTSGFTYGSGVVADAVGDFYVTGSFSGTRTLGSGANVVSLSASAPSDFIAKYAANGTLLWAKQIVSAIGEYFSKIMLDSFGNVYVAGEISGNATLGGLSLTAGANGNSVFLAKLDSNGNPLWATTVLDNAVEPNVGLAVDSSGNAYVAGGFSSSATVATSPVTTLTSAGGNDVFVVKYSPQGAAQWAENYGGKGDDAADSAAIGPDGNPVITGTFNSSASFGATTLTSGSSFANDFVAKINAADGSVVWADALSSTLDSGPPTYGNVDPTSRIAVDSAGNVYSTGSYDGTIQLNPTAATDAVQGTNAMFISKLDTNGKFVWGKGFSISPNGYDVEGFGIAVDPNGNVFSTGTFARTINFDPAGSSAGNLTANGASYDIYLSELDSNGKFVNVQQFGGSGEDGGSMVSVDANSNVYLTGLSYGPATFGKIIVGAKGDQDIFVARIGPNITPRTNIAPSFNILGPLQAVSLNAPPQTAPNFLNNIVPGLPGEQNEVVNFNVTNDNPALFTVPPAIDSNGTLTYTPAPGVSGSTTVTVLAHNNGGTANGGSDTSAAKTFPITVNVNHAPSFTGGANRTVNENSGPELYSGWATNLSAGPPGEANQTLTFHTAVSITAGGPDVMSGASSLFSSGPSIDSAGNLSFTPAADEWGTA
ncbi:MAG TPA: SBBP repeat-containing protein, partial [Pirellulales bacterium]